MTTQARRLCRRPFSIEYLENRLVLSASPLDSSFVLPNNQSLQDLGILAEDLNGQTSYVYKDQWVGSFSGWSGPRNQQLETMQSLLGQIDPGIQVIKSLGSTGQFLFQTSDDVTQDQLAGELSAITGFKYVEHNFLMLPTAAPNDPSFPSQWALNNTGQTGGVVGADIKALTAWNTTTGSSGVVVGVIDSGVDYTHADLAANMWVNPGETPGDGIDNDGNGYVDDIYGWDFANNDSNPMDDNGHGTMVSGLIAARGNNSVGITGINWGAKIMALKYAKSDFVSSTADVIEAVNYATMMRTTYGVNIRATNNSYGIFGNSQGFSDAIEASGEAGIMFVSSAGNTSSDNDTGPQYPANYPLENVISVAATDDHDQLASFSSYGATTVHLGAPGVNVLTTRMGGGYTGFNGTSASSPMVAGVVALLWDAAPYATLDEIKAALLNGTQPIPALDGITVTGGRLDATGAMNQLGFHVVQITPNQGDIVISPPTQFTVTFSDDFVASSVDAGDLLVNGVAATSVSTIGTRTALFSFSSSPILVEGLQQIRLLDGSVSRLSDADAVTGVITTFRYDATPLQVTSVVPSSGSTVNTPLDQIVVSFNEAIDPASISSRSLVLSRGQVTGASIVNSTTVLFSISGAGTEGSLVYSVPGKTITDIYGNPANPFTATIDLDNFEKTLAFTRVDPAGSLVFTSLNNSGLINANGDADDYLVTLMPGETLTAIVRSVSGTPTLSAQFVGLGSAVSSTPGGSVIVPLVAATNGGTYRLRISGNTRADYSFDVYRNTAVEWSDSTTLSPIALNSTPLSAGGGTRSAVIGTSQAANFYWNMDNNPGWTLSGSWAWGKPAGLAGDPSTGYTGNNVVGYNLNGAYSNSMLATQYATLGPINLTGKTGVSLSFRRWLGVQSSTFDRATIQVSNNGTTWTTIYTNPTTNLVETSWSLQTYDISAVADNKSTVYVRWGMGTTNSSTTFSGWNIDDVVIRGVQDPPASALDEDVYSVDLSSSVGHSIDFTLKGLSGVDFSTSQFLLLAPNGTTVATGTTKPNASGPTVTNADLVIQGFKVVTPGVYSLVLRTNRTGQYSVVMTDNVQFDAEPNDSVAGALTRTLDPLNHALGFVGVPPLLGAYGFTVNSGLSNITLTAHVSSVDGEVTVPITAQQPGSLVAQMAGNVTAYFDGSTIRFQAASLDVLPHAGSYQPGSSAADFAGQVDLGGAFAYAAVRNVQFTLGSNPLVLDSSGNFDATALRFEFTEGEIDYSLFGTTGNFPVETPDTGNPVSGPGQVQVSNGVVQLTIPLRMAFVAAVPLGLNVTFEFNATLTATVAVPVPNDDYYSFNMAQNDVATIDVSTLPYAMNLSDPLFLPQITIYAPNGSVVSTVAGTLANPNPSITFTATQAGLYRVAVGSAAGQGEYTISLDRTEAPTVAITGPAAIVRGENVEFVLTQTNSDLSGQTNPWTFDIDWNGDGLFDQQVVGASGIAVTHVFTTTQSTNVNVRVTGDNTLASPTTTLPVNVLAYAFKVNADDPTKTDFVYGGTMGDDWFGYFYQFGVFVVVRENSQDINEFVALPNNLGKIIVYAQDGNDLIDGRAPVDYSYPVEFYGGVGNDTLFGGSLGDFLFGGEGDDLLIGSFGDDTIYGQGGNDTISGGGGSNILDGGEGADFITISSLYETVFGANGADAINWDNTISGGGGNDTIYGGLHDSAIDGGEGNDVIFDSVETGSNLGDTGSTSVDGGEGNDILVGSSRPGSSVDTLIGGKGNDILIAQYGTSILQGGVGSDLLIAGIIPTNSLLITNLLAIQSEWTSTRTYVDRIANLEGTGVGPRNNGDVYLTPGDTVIDNDTIDQVFGEADQDWFFANPGEDILSDVDVSEVVRTLP